MTPRAVCRNAIGQVRKGSNSGRRPIEATNELNPRTHVGDRALGSNRETPHPSDSILAAGGVKVRLGDWIDGWFRSHAQPHPRVHLGTSLCTSATQYAPDQRISHLFATMTRSCSSLSEADLSASRVNACFSACSSCLGDRSWRNRGLR
ncbi:hypothetical protein MRB53_040766 [Persea americana]|nr:hypothetical protein MRB53_040766 [Persea americana]